MIEDISDEELWDESPGNSSQSSKYSPSKTISSISLDNTPIISDDDDAASSPDKTKETSPTIEIDLVAEEDLEHEDDVKIIETNDVSELPNYYPALQGCRSVENFTCLNRIEEGTYGVVYRCMDKSTKEVVALKRLKMENEKDSFPITALREIKALLKTEHINIVRAREIVVGPAVNRIFIVMDYMEHDLKSLMTKMNQRKQVFSPSEVKCLSMQLMSAVVHLHDNWILHRDIKPSNLLLSNNGILKVGDFGLAREYGSPLKQYTSLVVTLWYRAPELLLKLPYYSTPVDMWSVGCIVAELLLMKSLFQSNSEIEQLKCIFQELGTPNPKIWPDYNNCLLKNIVSYTKFTEYPVSNINRRFNKVTGQLGIDLISSLLLYNPKKRLTAQEALDHMYFKETPLPASPSSLQCWPNKNDYKPLPTKELLNKYMI